MNRRHRVLWALGLVLTCWLSTPTPLFAALPSPDGPSPASSAPISAPQTSVTTTTIVQEKWMEPPASWWEQRFGDALLKGLVLPMTLGLRDATQAVMGGESNVITQTPAAVSYRRGSVVSLWRVVRTVATMALVVVLAWGGITVLVREGIGVPSHDVMILLPRVIVAGLLINGSLTLAQVAIDLNNAVCAAVMPSVGMPGWSSAQSAVTNVRFALFFNVTMLVYLLTVLLLLMQMLLRVALVDVLIVLAPLAFVCWVLPQTQGWTRTWSSTFVGAVFSQLVQVVALRVGGEFIMATPAASETQVLGLFLGVASIMLALRVPGLMSVHLGSATGIVRWVLQRRASQQMRARTGGS